MNIGEKISSILIRQDLPSRIHLQMKWLWIWTLAAFFCICVMTSIAYALGIEVVFLYGLILIVFYLIYMPCQAMLRNIQTINFLFLLSIILLTGIAMLILGGIATSMGLIFVGLTCAFSSVLLNNAQKTIVLFVVYALTILIVALSQGLITVPEYVTPANNLLFYVLNILWISGTTLMFILFYIRQQRDIDLSESRKLKELDEAKTKLYTNITHEFRTPLTIILGMTDLIQRKNGDLFADELEQIRAKGKKLLNLINQMLDLSKLESGMMKSDPVNGDIILYLKYLTESFASYAESRNIGMDFFSPHQEFNMDYDPDKLIHIVSNLLSNAIKYTNDGGNVGLHAKLEEEPGKGRSFIIEVEDTGIGIAENELEFVFNRFYRANDAGTFDTGGSGLGLSLTRELVHLLDGDIWVKSRPGDGATFTVRLPVENNEIPQPEITYEGIEKSVSPYLYLDQNHEYPDLVSLYTETEKPILLIVEDNKDVVKFLCEILKEKYSIEIAYNGREGLEKALRVIPDIIISDLMMPVMNGYEFLENVKKDIRTSHIPVVILTAKADNLSKIQGLKKGSDAFLPKPFDQTELFIRLENLIEARKRIQNHFAFSGSSESKQFARDIPIEVAFMKQVREIIENNLAEEEFGILKLCREMNMSRAQLYRKFKALTNQTVGRYIRSIRLNRAKELLSSTTLTVSEVAFQVGFKSISHFSMHFKQEYGINPSKVGI